MSIFLDNKLWQYFVKNPFKKIHIRALSRELDLAPSTITKLSQDLIKKNLLKKEKIGKNIILSSNYAEDDFIYYKKWCNIFLLLESGLIKDLKKISKTIILFGSYSKGEDSERSDIDIAVDKELDINLEKYEKYLNRKIQYHAITRKMNKHLLENIKQGILLEGVMP